MGRARAQANHFGDLYERAKQREGWFTELLTIDDTKAYSRAQVDDDIASGEMTPTMAKQEYWCSFAGSVEGAYYASELEQALADGRIGKVPWEPALPVHTAWDLGLDDATSIWFFQRTHQEIRLIDYYESSGVGLEHYVRELDRKPYSYGDHFLPHDVEVKELGTGRSRLQMLRGLGLECRVVPRLSVEDGISAVRSILNRCWFDEAKCAKGLKALRAYRCEFDTKTQTNRQRPLHDWTSHAADAFRYLALSLERVDRRARRQPIYVESVNGNYFA